MAICEAKYNLNLMTINIRGLNDRRKRRSVFRWIKKQKIDICLVQESYSSPEIENIWSNEWGRKIIFSHGTRHGRGVLLLIRPGLDIEIHNTHTDDIGRVLMLDASIQDVSFKICNIYAPNSEDGQLHFYNYIRSLLDQKLNRDDKIIIGGDFNVIFNPSLDRKASTVFQESAKYKRIRSCIEEIQSNLETQDIWRIKNPNTTRYTWHRENPSKVKSRLDYLLMSESMSDATQEIDIIPCIKSDHSAVVLKLNNNETVKKGRGLWKLNTSFIDEADYIKGIIENKIKWLEEFQDIAEAGMKWELIKYRIRQYSMDYGRKKAQKLSTEEKDLEDKLKDLETQQDSITNDVEKERELKNAIGDVTARLNEIYDYKTKGLIMRAQVRWYEKGEKSNDYFLRLANRNKIKKNVGKLKRQDDSYTVDPKEILSMQAKFYESLYANKSVKSSDDISQYLQCIETPTLTDDEKELCEGLITTEECRATIKSFKNNKTPGNDGLPIEFYLKFWPIFGQLVVDSFNSGYMRGEMTTSQRQAVITLLDKGKDRSLLKNWRPISLLNVDYKIASKTIANRLIRYLPKLIHPNQVGYVKNRNITDNIRTVIDLMEYLKEENLPGILINIDFEKAFDSVDWTFLRLVLNKFNFGESIIAWIKMFYTNISSCIINNGATSNYFPVHRGVRQGDPLSPYLFILCGEILASRIRQNNNIEGIQLNDLQLKLLQYADDTNGILKDRKSAKLFLNEVEYFGTFSGLKLNKDKTEGMWLGSFRDQKCKPLGIKWPEEPLKMLGVYLSYDLGASRRRNFEDKLIKIKTITNMWRGRNLTMLGRTQIIKTFLISQLLYVSSALDIPEDIVREVDNIIFSFIWNGKRAKIKRSVLKRNIPEGGLKIPDLETMLKTSRLKWVNRLISEPEVIWPFFLSRHLQKSQIHLNALLYANFDIKHLHIKPGAIPDFYLKMLKVWSEVGDNTRDKQTFLWYNKNILINKKSFFYKEFFRAGAWYVHDLYGDDGTIIPFQTWVARGVNNTSMIRWMGLINITGNLRNALDPPTTPGEDSCKMLISFNDIKIPLSQCFSNILYLNLLKQKFGHDVCIPRVTKYLTPRDSDNWIKAYVRANKYPVDTKTKEFQFKFLHDCLVNRYWLKKWKLVDNDQCQVCETSSDNILHVYWECQSTRAFWTNFVDWCEPKIGYFNFSIDDVFLGCDNEILCCLIFFAKRHIYLKRLSSEAPNWACFLSNVRAFRDMELYIAQQNNTLEKFTNKWQNIAV